MFKNILELNNLEAKKFFLSQEAFLRVNLPAYFSFESVLNEIDKTFKNKILTDNEIMKAKAEETTNYILYNNKDGKHAWRKYQIINPFIYVSLVNIITDEKNWSSLQRRFTEFQDFENIRCESIPIIPLDKKKTQQSEQISQWVNCVEKKSISLALEYNFLYHTDITDCYGSIYTHSISWAIHTKQVAKENRDYKGEQFGNKIDHHIQAMSSGQTNGIPQGSILMDFIAEIVLGYADLELSEMLKGKLDHENYYILRYRDDYRIFVNDIGTGDLILKYLGETLLNLGLHLHANKTSFHQDVITGSFKEEKIDSLNHELIPDKLSQTALFRQLLITQQIGKKFPNSGTMLRRLSKIFGIVKFSDCKGQEEALTSILLDIGYNHPKTFPLIASLMSVYIPSLKEHDQQKLLNKIQKKIHLRSNMGLLELWIQRIVLGLKLELTFQEPLCKYANGDHNQNIFNSDWIENRKIKNILDATSYVDQAKINNLKPKIEQHEVQIFNYEDAVFINDISF